MDRRTFLSAGALAAAGLSFPFVATGRADPSQASRVRNVIFLVSDGMSAGVLDLADRFSHQVRGKGTRWPELIGQPGVVNALQQTESLNSPVTDSSAASSAWGSGCRINNGSLNVAPDEKPLVPLAVPVKETGRSIGLIATCTITHATPAGFAAAVPSRRMEEEIALQYYQGGIDLMLGGGASFFDPEQRADGRDLFSDFARDGAVVCRSRDELLQVEPGKQLLGVFADGHLPFTVDQRHDSELQKMVPTLAEMAKVGLNWLNTNRDGFVCQIEGARVDHAAHANDAAALVWDQIAFDDALAVALEFAKEDGETLVVVTTDHGNSNPGLNGWGPRYAESGERFATLERATASTERIYPWLMGELGKGTTEAKALQEGFEERLGFQPNEREMTILIESAVGDRVHNWNQQLSNFRGLLGQIAGNHNGIGWTGTTHTSDPVILTTLGPGSDQFSGYVPNYQIHHSMCDLLGIDFRNEPTQETARHTVPAKA